MANGSGPVPPAKVGTVRPSQMVHTYGVGAVVELPNFSVIVSGLDGAVHSGDPWDTKKANTVIEEERLLELVQQALGPTVTELRGPTRIDPPPGSTKLGPWDWAGTWTMPFPRWLRCTACKALSRYHEKFTLKHDRHRQPHEARFMHESCTVTNNPPASPVRFVLACANGHLDDFPWGAWAHRKTGFQCPVAQSPSGNLRLLDTGLSQRPTSQKVVCANSGCDAEAAVQPAFGPDGWTNLPKCGGGRPHLGDRVECDQRPIAVLVGATNLWFADRRGVLSIPHDEVALVTRVVREHRDQFESRADRSEFLKYAAAMAEFGAETWLRDGDYTEEELWDEYERQEKEIEDPDATPDVLGPEWVALTQPIQGDHPDFKVEATPERPKTEASGFLPTRLVTRLREVSALVGFTRLDSPTENGVTRADLAANKARWVPATVALGEGVLVRLEEDAVQAWEVKVAKSDRMAQMEAAHNAWRARRTLEPSVPPSARFVLLHSLAHLLIHEISHEAGYAAASIRERLYARAPGPGVEPMAGVLVYTAAADAEGTLGGLVSLGQPDRLGAIINSALHRAAFCTSDPFCATHTANGTVSGGTEGDGTLHGAACHVCQFISETSCDHANRYLDRNLLVQTIDGGDDGFFTLS